MYVKTSTELFLIQDHNPHESILLRGTGYFMNQINSQDAVSQGRVSVHTRLLLVLPLYSWKYSKSIIKFEHQ